MTEEKQEREPVPLTALPPEEFADLAEAIEYVDEWLRVIGSAATSRDYSVPSEPSCEGVRDAIGLACADVNSSSRHSPRGSRFAARTTASPSAGRGSTEPIFKGQQFLRTKRTRTLAHLRSGSVLFPSDRWGSIPRRPDGLHPADRAAVAARAEDPQAFALVLTLLDAGLRVGEALGLKWGAIRWG